MDPLLDIIAHMQAERAQFAHIALAQPAGHDAFDYGRACGIYLGLTKAIEVINTVVEERDDEDRRK